jgi:hypothetical protein
VGWGTSDGQSSVGWGSPIAHDTTAIAHDTTAGTDVTALGTAAAGAVVVVPPVTARGGRRQVSWFGLS